MQTKSEAGGGEQCTAPEILWVWEEVLSSSLFALNLPMQDVGWGEALVQTLVQGALASV